VPTKTSSIAAARLGRSPVVSTAGLAILIALASAFVALPCALIALTPATCGATTWEGFDPGGTGAGYPERANGERTEQPSLEACRLEGAFKLDGRLDDPAWKQAEAATGFRQFSPDREAPAGEPTVVKVLYDDDAIYFGVACYRTNGHPIASCLSRRDRITASDRIRIYVDPYHDLRSGYHFRVNPDGVMEDYYNFDDLYHDISWDCVWQAKTSRDDGGWYAEVRVPFSSIRYRAADSMTWGFNVFNYIQSRGEQTGWSVWDRDLSGFMSRSGTLTGIRGVRPPRQLELAPYAVGRLTDPSAPRDLDETDRYGNFGLDLKYGVTANLTLNATFQPDFGQVEADPAVLNLSPYETFYEEKRPFFIEGNHYFEHPDFALFYSRRIGTGSENSRIRFASKLVGRTAGGISMAWLVAATDEAMDGRAHNPLQSGTDEATYVVGRMGKEFDGGNHRVNLHTTAVQRPQGRDGYVAATDFELQFKDRAYVIDGSAVGSLVDPTEGPGDEEYGAGARFEMKKVIGTWRGRLVGRLEHDKLDLNDLGYIRDPDQVAMQAVLEHYYNPDNETSFFSQGQTSVSFYRNWFYADRRVPDPEDPTQDLWAYGKGHSRYTQSYISGYWQARSCWAMWYELEHAPEWTSSRETRSYHGVAGPLMTMPATRSGYVGFNTDSRRNLILEGNLNFEHTSGPDRTINTSLSATWIQSSRVQHGFSLGYSQTHSNAQWVGNFGNPGGGIGGVSYVFGEMKERVWDLTLRSSLVFTRDQTLELYAQPFLAVGDYTDARELVKPDTRDLAPFTAEGFAIRDNDFSFGAVNLNLVYRWEYRPGSTLYLVWTHSRSRYDFRGDPSLGPEFDNGFGTDPMFRNEPENRFLVKLSYWWAL
jgi:hypothetical protein